MSKWADKLKTFFAGNAGLNDSFFEDLSDLLVEGDFGAKLAVETVDTLKSYCTKNRIKLPEQARSFLASMLLKYLVPVSNPELFENGMLNIMLLIGVNGVGKTTTTAKLAARAKNAGFKPILAAADTFRAAAADQLKIHGERIGVRVVAHKSGADPAAVLHDTINAAINGGYNALFADTAGRMHTKNALIEELAKISRVVERFSTEESTRQAARINYRKLLVLDATTGANAVFQTEVFLSAIRPDGVILTKFDSGARGGIVFQLAVKFAIPVLFVCDGECYEDIYPFNAAEFVRGFTE